jgi:hypothetical protein
LDLEEIDDLLDGLAMLDLFPARPAVEESAGHEVLFHEHVTGGHDVVLRAQPGVELYVLEAPGDPQPGQPVRSLPGDLLVLEIDLARLRLVEAADTVEQSRLPRAVGADDGEDLVGADIEVDVRERLHAAEAERHVIDAHYHAHRV